MKKPETLFEYNYEPVNANQVLAAAHKRIAELKSRIAEADEKIRLNDARIANLNALTANIDAQIEVQETLLASKDHLTYLKDCMDSIANISFDQSFPSVSVSISFNLRISSSIFRIFSD